KSTAASVRDQIVDAVRSLASFLVAIKQLEPPQAAKELESSGVLRELATSERQTVLSDLAENASYFFEHPDLDPDGDLVDKYLDDLAAHHAQTAPRTAGIEQILEDVAAYLRRSSKKMQGLIEKHYAARLAERLPVDVPQRRFPAAATRA